VDEGPSRTEAIVVGGIDHGDADRVVHLLGETGRLEVFAPGARRSRRRFAGVFEPFQTIEIELHRSPRRGALRTATSARVSKPRLGVRTGLDRIALASYGVELARRVAPEGGVFDGLARLTELLDFLDGAPAEPCVRRAFEVRLLASLGYHPALDACVACGRREPPFRLDFEGGGVHCPEHAARGDRIGPGTQAWLRRILADPEFSPRGPHDAEDARRAAKTAGPAVDRFFAELVSGPLRTRTLLNELGL